jgi:hypothetical protein
MNLQDTLRETERNLRKVYSLKIRKYLALIYILVGLYFPEIFALSLFHFNPSILNFIEESMFLFIVWFSVYVDIKLSKALAILRKLHNAIVNSKVKYSLNIPSIAFLVFVVITVLYIGSYLEYVFTFAFLEYYLFYHFFHDKVQINIEDWVAMITALSLIFIPLDYLPLSIFFSASWISAGIISLVRVYG